MLKFNIIFISSIIFVVASECYLSDGVNRFNFKKTHDGSDEYDFELIQLTNNLVTRINKLVKIATILN